MKLTVCDTILSKCVRERNNWICESCGIISEDGRATGGDRAMQHSHYQGRKYKRTRYMMENALCLCAKCHARVEEDPYAHTELFTSIWGKGMAENLSQLNHQPYKPVGGWKEFEKEAAKHYRKEFERMRSMRLEGNKGRIEFEGYI